MYPNLEAELGRRKMSKKDLATLTGMRYNTLCDKCSEKFSFTLNEAIIISDVLGNPMPIEELFMKEVKS